MVACSKDSRCWLACKTPTVPYPPSDSYGVPTTIWPVLLVALSVAKLRSSLSALLSCLLAWLPLIVYATRSRIAPGSRLTPPWCSPENPCPLTITRHSRTLLDGAARIPCEGPAPPPALLECDAAIGHLHPPEPQCMSGLQTTGRRNREN